MHELTQLIKKDMLPALGVTEPGAIAFCVAKARTYLGGELKHLNVAMNSGMYKNAFTAGSPTPTRWAMSSLLHLVLWQETHQKVWKLLEE